MLKRLRLHMAIDILVTLIQIERTQERRRGIGTTPVGPTPHLHHFGLYYLPRIPPLSLSLSNLHATTQSNVTLLLFLILNS